ncbi:hypothetical protein NH340_JMT05006 [Sarcoptes scabiei]|nr:hypothetical protein NH340_JMT05006 [Sarcoptes scabiei]
MLGSILSIIKRTKSFSTKIFFWLLLSSLLIDSIHSQTPFIHSNHNRSSSNSHLDPISYFHHLFSQAIPLKLEPSRTKVFLITSSPLSNINEKNTNNNNNNSTDPFQSSSLLSSSSSSSPLISSTISTVSNHNETDLIFNSVGQPVERRKSIYMLFPREQLLTSASDTINNNRSIGNDSQLLTNPFSSAPYQSSNDFINTLIQNVFSDLTLQSLPPEEILFGKLPIRSNSNSNQSSSSSSIFQLNTDEIFGPNNTVSNQSISSIPKEFSTTPSITNSNNYQPNPPFNITPSPISISDNWRYPPIPPRYEAGVQYSEPDEPMLGLERDAYNVDLTRLSSTIGRQASNRISDNPTTTTIVSDNFNNRLNPTTIPINNFDSPSLPSTRSTEIPDLRRVLNRTLSNTSRAPNLVLHEQYSDVDSNPKRTQINSYEFSNRNYSEIQNNFGLSLKPTTATTSTASLAKPLLKISQPSINEDSPIDQSLIRTQRPLILDTTTHNDQLYRTVWPFLNPNLATTRANISKISPNTWSHSPLNYLQNPNISIYERVWPVVQPQTFKHNSTSNRSNWLRIDPRKNNNFTSILAKWEQSNRLHFRNHSSHLNDWPRIKVRNYSLPYQTNSLLNSTYHPKVIPIPATSTLSRADPIFRTTRPNLLNLNGLTVPGFSTSDLSIEKVFHPNTSTTQKFNFEDNYDFQGTSVSPPYDLTNPTHSVAIEINRKQSTESPSLDQARLQAIYSSISQRSKPRLHSSSSSSSRLSSNVVNDSEQDSVMISSAIAQNLVNIISLPNYKFYLGKKGQL